VSEITRVRPPGCIVVAFAAETTDVVVAGRAKLARKGADLVIANEVGRDGTGFGSATNHAAIIGDGDGDVSLRDWAKDELATAILDRIVGRLH